MIDQRFHLVVLCMEWPSASRHVGGVGRYVFRLTEWFASRVRVSVVTGPDPRPLAGVDLYSVAPAMFDDRARRYYLAPFAAAKLVRGLDPDVVHAHGDDMALAWGRRGAPIIRTYYGRSSVEARSGRWQRRANHVALAALEHCVRPRVAKAVGIGPDSVAAYRADALIPPVLPQDLPPSMGKKSEEPTIVFIGGFLGRKRGALAVEAVERCRRRCPLVHLVVFGPETDRAWYPAWVDFRSGATDAEIRSVLADAWLLLAPSTYEGFGIPAWEAMGAGAVVIGTPNPGLRFLAERDAAAVVGDSALEERVAALIADPDLRQAIAIRGRARAETVARMAEPERYLALMGDVG